MYRRATTLILFRLDFLIDELKLFFTVVNGMEQYIFIHARIVLIAELFFFIGIKLILFSFCVMMDQWLVILRCTRVLNIVSFCSGQSYCKTSPGNVYNSYLSHNNKHCFQVCFSKYAIVTKCAPLCQTDMTLWKHIHEMNIKCKYCKSSFNPPPPLK